MVVLVLGLGMKFWGTTYTLLTGKASLLLLIAFALPPVRAIIFCVTVSIG